MQFQQCWTFNNDNKRQGLELGLLPKHESPGSSPGPLCMIWWTNELELSSYHLASDPIQPANKKSSPGVWTEWRWAVLLPYGYTLPAESGNFLSTDKLVELNKIVMGFCLFVTLLTCWCRTSFCNRKAVHLQQFYDVIDRIYHVINLLLES